MDISPNKNDFKPMSLMSLCLSFISLSIVSFLLFSKADPTTKYVFKSIDALICCLFLLQLTVDFFRSADKKHYFKTHWIDILASIPMIEALRFARIFQILRIVMVLRASHHFLAQYLTNRKEATIATILTLLVLLLTVGSSLVLVVESNDPQANITNAPDALWWAFVTISTVGYGDHYPITFVGRIIAGVMIIAGVGIFGMISGLVASMITTPKENREHMIANQHDKAILDKLEQMSVDQQSLLKQVDDLKNQIKQLQSAAHKPD